MRRHLRMGIPACVVATALGMVSGTASRAFDLAVGILEMDSTNTCVLLRTPPTNDRFLLPSYGSFSPGDTVAVVYRQIEQRPCNATDSYPFLVGGSISRHRDTELGCGLVEVRSACALFHSEWYGWTLRLEGYDGGYAYASLTGTFVLDCSVVPDCPARYCVSDVEVGPPCDDPAVEVTTWGRVKSAYGP